MTVMAEDLKTYADEAGVLAAKSRGMGEWSSKAADLIDKGAYYLRVASFVETVEEIMYKHEMFPYSTDWDRVLEVGSWVITTSSPTHDRQECVNLTVCVRRGEQAEMWASLLPLADGWSGDDTDPDEVYSPFGWISVRTEARPAPRSL